MTGAGVEARRPGRPRSTEADAAILAAALEEYADRGFDGLTVDAVAARAGVGKATIYRRFPCKVDLVMAAAARFSAEQAPFPDTGSLRGDLQTLLRNLRHLVRDTTVGRGVRRLVADSRAHEELGKAHHAFVTERRARAMAVLQRGVDRGELRADADREVLCDMLVGPLFYRNLISDGPVDDPFLDAVVDALLAAFAPARA